MSTTKQASATPKANSSASKDAGKSNNSNKSASGKAGKASKSGKANDSRLEEFFHDELKDLYWAEQHLVKTLPKLAKAANSEELKAAFAEHLEVTKNHVTRLEDAFGILGYPAEAKKCEAMAGITKEGEEIIEDTEDGTSTRDVGLILAGQKAEHYEIASYGGLAQLARTLGHDDIAELLASTLAEEKEADQSLTAIAESAVNDQAADEKE